MVQRRLHGNPEAQSRRHLPALHGLVRDANRPTSTLCAPQQNAAKTIKLYGGIGPRYWRQATRGLRPRVNTLGGPGSVSQAVFAEPQNKAARGSSVPSAGAAGYQAEAAFTWRGRLSDRRPGKLRQGPQASDAAMPFPGPSAGTEAACFFAC